MLTFPLADGGSFIVIEPGNIARLKSGRPLKIGDSVLICFTPDMNKFVEQLGVKNSLPKRGERIECHLRLTPEQIDAALKACQNLPEVQR